MSTKIKIDTALGTVRVDVTTDIDHLAKYRLYLWRKVGGAWQLQPGTVEPEFRTTLDPDDHTLTPTPAALHGLMLQLVAKVASLTKNPGRLELVLHVHQDPVSVTPQTEVGVAASYPVDHHTPVPPGQELRIVSNWLIHAP